MKAQNTQSAVPPIEVTAEERYHLINDAAYFRSLRRKSEVNRPDAEAVCWCECEAEIDRVLEEHHAKCDKHGAGD